LFLIPSFCDNVIHGTFVVLVIIVQRMNTFVNVTLNSLKDLCEFIDGITAILIVIELAIAEAMSSNGVEIL